MRLFLYPGRVLRNPGPSFSIPVCREANISFFRFNPPEAGKKPGPRKSGIFSIQCKALEAKKRQRLFRQPSAISRHSSWQGLKNGKRREHRLSEAESGGDSPLAQQLPARGSVFHPHRDSFQGKARAKAAFLRAEAVLVPSPLGIGPSSNKKRGSGASRKERGPKRQGSKRPTSPPETGVNEREEETPRAQTRKRSNTQTCRRASGRRADTANEESRKIQSKTERKIESLRNDIHRKPGWAKRKAVKRLHGF